MTTKRPSLSSQSAKKESIEALKRAWEAGMSAKASYFQKKINDADGRLAARGLGPMGGARNRAYYEIRLEQIEFGSSLFSELVQTSGVEIKSDEALKEILQVGMKIMEPIFKGMEDNDDNRLRTAGYGPIGGTGNKTHQGNSRLRSEYNKQLRAKLLKLQLVAGGKKEETPGSPFELLISLFWQNKKLRPFIRAVVAIGALAVLVIGLIELIKLIKLLLEF